MAQNGTQMEQLVQAAKANGWRMTCTGVLGRGAFSWCWDKGTERELVTVRESHNGRITQAQIGPVPVTRKMFPTILKELTS